MKKIVENTLIVITGIIITLLVNTVIEFISFQEGNVNISPPINIGSSSYLPITIENISFKTLSNIGMSIPRQADISSISTSYPVKIISTESNINNKMPIQKITISGINPKSKLSIMIPLPKQSDYSLCAVLNPRESNILVTNISKIENPIKEAFLNGLEIAIIYSFLFSIFLFFVDRNQGKLLEMINKTKREIEMQESECISCRKAAEEKAKDAVKSLKRIQVVLLARISDYAKELSFWRDTIRKILYRIEIENKNELSEILIKSVTDNLKTYSTLNKYDQHSFESIEVLADMIAYRETKKSKKHQKE